MNLRRVAIVIVAAFVTSAPVIAAAAPPAGTLMTDDQHPVATLTVTGRGQISRSPDLATVAVTIVTNDAVAARALSENNRRYAALTAKLTADGIAASDVNSTSISSYFNPRPHVPEPNGGQLFGFIVTRNVQINVTALAATGSVVDTATAAGATQINDVSFGFRDRRGVERAALAAAATDAYAQAQTLADAAHVRIVRVLRIGDESGSSGRIQPQAMMAVRAAQDSVPTTIAPSDLEITSSVSITYAIR